jgi:hypothetical protein
MHDEQKDHHAHSDPDGKTKNIDQREDFILFEIPPSYQQVVPDHCVQFKRLNVPLTM